VPDSKNQRPYGLRPADGISDRSVAIWLVSCLLHSLLLFLLSRLPAAHGIGGSAGSGGAGGNLVLEARFLAGSDDDRGNENQGSEEREGTIANEVRLVSIVPTESRTLEPPPEEETEADAPSEVITDDSPADPPPASRWKSAPRNAQRKKPDADEPVSRRAGARAETAVENGSTRGRAPGHGGSGSAGGRQGSGTTFFDVPGHGTRFVYVIDRSISMEQKHRFKAARAELLASLRELPSTALVEVIFYNDTAVWLSAGDRPALSRNTPVQQHKFAQFAASIQPDGGTNHMRALQFALKAGPEAIFLLTDADEPKLHAGDLDQIVRANRRRTTIHAIELGVGALLDDDNFLMRLARQNRGTYRYWDIEQLSNAEETAAAGEAASR
jgi:Ca-activated chloride channel family protein